MRPAHAFRLRFAAVLLGACLLPVISFSADTLTWRGEAERVDAAIENWPLPRLLEQLATSTGWQVFVDPEAKLRQPVSARFRNLPPGEALGRLLGELNYALLPQSEGPARLFVFRTSVNDATKRVSPRPLEKAVRIANELIVMRKPGADESIEELAHRLGAKITGRSEDLRAYRLQFESEASERLAQAALQSGGDWEMDYNYPVTRPAAPELLASGPGQLLALKPDTGAGSGQFIVGLIDTAVQKNSPYSEFLLPGISVGSGDPAAGSLPSHGTTMFETLLRGLATTEAGGAATPVRVLPVDVYGAAGTASTFDVARGIVEAINGGADVVNLSLGSPGDSTLLSRVVRDGASRGVLFVASAGNEPTTAPTYPAAYPEVIAVTAGNRNGQVASYANRGAFVDVIAPSSSIVQYGGRAYYVSGTSASAAYISGVAAGWTAGGGQPPQVADQLRRTFGFSPTGK